MSAFLDNIAAAVIGGVVARRVYNGKVSVGFLAAIVASANAGGAGSVIGDTTTTMMWLAGVSPLALAPAFIGAIVSFAIFGLLGAYAQHRFAPILHRTTEKLTIDWIRVGVVVGILAAIVITNVGSNIFLPGLEEGAPLLGIAIWIAILLALFVRKLDWSIAPAAAKGALFLIALVALASLVPVDLCDDRRGRSRSRWDGCHRFSTIFRLRRLPSNKEVTIGHSWRTPLDSAVRWSGLDHPQGWHSPVSSLRGGQ